MAETPKLIDLLKTLQQNDKESIKSFDDVLTLNSCYNRHLLIGDIEEGIGVSIESLIKFYNQMDDESGIPVEERTPIKIFIDSNGGDLNETFTIIDSIKLSKTPVWTINIGKAYSGGFFIFIAGDHRIAYPYSSFLYHEGSASKDGSANQFENFASFYKKMLKMLKTHVLATTKITEKKYEEIRKEDFWMMADEALELGVADEIAKEFIQ